MSNINKYSVKFQEIVSMSSDIKTQQDASSSPPSLQELALINVMNMTDPFRMAPIIREYINGISWPIAAAISSGIYDDVHDPSFKPNKWSDIRMLQCPIDDDYFRIGAPDAGITDNIMDYLTQGPFGSMPKMPSLVEIAAILRNMKWIPNTNSMCWFNNRHNFSYAKIDIELSPNLYWKKTNYPDLLYKHLIYGTNDGMVEYYLNGSNFYIKFIIKSDERKDTL
jgi:hypothetical protein